MERAQAHTLEAFMAALLLVGSVVFALQATAVTPLSASTSNQHIQNQQRAVATDLLAAAANGSLRTAVLYWNASAGGFNETGSRGYYTDGGPPTYFGRLLNETFREDRIAFNVYVRYHTDGAPGRVTMVDMGTPSDNAVAATRSVAVFNGSALTGPGASATVGEAAANGNFYAPDIAPGRELYNVMEVRIVVWQM